MSLTARTKGGRAAARGGLNKIKAANMVDEFIRDAKRPPRQERSYPPQQRIKKLKEMLAQCELAYKNTGSWTARKKIVLIQEHIKIAEAELNLPSIW